MSREFDCIRWIEDLIMDRNRKDTWNSESMSPRFITTLHLVSNFFLSFFTVGMMGIFRRWSSWGRLQQSETKKKKGASRKKHKGDTK